MTWQRDSHLWTSSWLGTRKIRALFPAMLMHGACPRYEKKEREVGGGGRENFGGCCGRGLGGCTWDDSAQVEQGVDNRTSSVLRSGEERLRRFQFANGTDRVVFRSWACMIDG